MTHSLHRRGDPEDLKNDFVFLSTPAMGINSEGSAEKFARIVDLIFETGPANLGSYETGSIFTGITSEEIKKNLKDNSRVRCSFDSREKIRYLLQRLKEEDLGISITISGLVDEILAIAEEVGLVPHSINCSAGVHGQVSLLPSEEILELTTMCGHGMIGSRLVQKILLDLKRKKCTLKEAAIELSKPCTCGIFNPTRAIKLLNRYQALYTIEEGMPSSLVLEEK